MVLAALVARGRFGGARLARLARPVDLLASAGPSLAVRHRRLAAAFNRRGAEWEHEIYRGIWEDAARELGAEVRPIGGRFLELSSGDSTARVWRHVTPLDDGVTLRLALDKPVVHRLLLDARIPVPEFVEFAPHDLRSARTFIGASPGPFVVKPANGTAGGIGVTCAVRTPGDVLRASWTAVRADARLLLERQTPGSMYRLLIMEGALIGAVRRDPPGVVGDGRTSVGGLMLAENRRRLDARGRAGIALLRPDLDCALTLRAQGLDFRSIPPAGLRIAVKTATSENRPDENQTLSPDACRGVTDIACAAAEALGLRLAGVDLITPDPSRDLATVGGCVIEVNGTPGLHYHYLVADPGSCSRVALPVLARLLGLSSRTTRTDSSGPRHATA